MSRAIDIVGMGMMTAVGVGARQTAASVNAGVARLSESAIHNKRFQPMVMALLPDDELPALVPSLDVIAGLTSRQMRMLRLAGPALNEAVLDLPSAAEVPLFLGAPEPPPGRPAPAGEKFLEHLAAQSGVTFDLARSRSFPSGRAAGLLALVEAMRLLEQGESRHVLVGGVDSYLDLYLLGTLDAESRVLADGVMDGFAPGEGASFLLLGNAGGKPGIARLAGAGAAAEAGHRYSEAPYRGDGLAEALQSAFASAGSDTPLVHTVYAGLNGEHLGAKEWGTAQLRNRERFAEDFRLEHPVDCFGDPGAALGPLLLGLGASALRSGHCAESCLVWCSSDREERGAALLRRPSA